MDGIHQSTSPQVGQSVSRTMTKLQWPLISTLVLKPASKDPRELSQYTNQLTIIRLALSQRCPPFMRPSTTSMEQPCAPGDTNITLLNCPQLIHHTHSHGTLDSIWLDLTSLPDVPGISDPCRALLGTWRRFRVQRWTTRLCRSHPSPSPLCRDQTKEGHKVDLRI